MKIPGLTQKRGYYYYRPPQIDGVRPKRIALRTKDFDKAVKLALELRNQSSVDLAKDRLSGDIKRFLQAKERGGDYRPRTLETVRNTLRQFEMWAGNPKTASINSDQIEDWKSSLVSKGMSKSGMVAYLRRVQSFFSWLKRNERILVNPFDRVKVPSAKGTKSVKYCTREEMDKLIETCTREDLRFVLMAGFLLGLRRTEIVEAIPGWFRTPGFVEISETATYVPKDAERRTVHYGQRFAAFLAEYGLRKPFMVRPEVRHGRANYRWDFRKPFEEHAREQGLDWVTPHVMRHTFATLHIQAGTPLPTVADWLGDSYDVTFRHYAAHAPTNAHVRNLD